MNIEIVKMEAGDVKDVISLGLSTKELQVNEDHPMYYGEKELTAALNSENEICLVAKVNGNFAGFRIAHYNPIFREAYLSDIAIKPEFRSMGIGKLFYKTTKEILKDKNVDWEWALVHEENLKMQKFMQKQGFVKGRKFYFFYKNEAE